MRRCRWQWFGSGRVAWCSAPFSAGGLRSFTLRQITSTANCIRPPGVSHKWKVTSPPGMRYFFSMKLVTSVRLYLGGTLASFRCESSSWLSLVVIVLPPAKLGRVCNAVCRETPHGKPTVLGSSYSLDLRRKAFYFEAHSARPRQASRRAGLGLPSKNEENIPSIGNYGNLWLQPHEPSPHMSFIKTIALKHMIADISEQLHA